MRFIIIVFCCLICIDISAQIRSRKEIRPEIEALRATLAAADVIYGRTTGAGETKAYKAFKKLVEKATIPELKILVKDKNTVVKGYAFWALVLRDRKAALLIKRKFKFSLKKVNTRLYGCIGDRFKLKDFVNIIYSLPDDQMEFLYTP